MRADKCKMLRHPLSDAADAAAPVSKEKEGGTQSHTNLQCKKIKYEYWYHEP